MRPYILFPFVFLIHVIAYTQISPETYHMRATYDLTYQPDSNNNLSRTKELFYLFISNQSSLFQSVNRYLRDSASMSEHAKGNKGGSDLNFGMNHITMFDYHLYKHSDSIITFQNIDRIRVHDLFYYVEKKDALDWVICPDTMRIGSLLCQKAQVKFGNRNWEAWFTSSIPVNDGPYKFCNLPGLIVKISDNRNFWQFNLEEIIVNNQVIVPEYLDPPVKLKDKKTFYDLKRKYNDNPVVMGEILAGHVLYIQGRTYAISNEKKRALLDNNWIELYNDPLLK